MNEHFLQYLWQNALVRFHELVTTDGQAVTIINRGMLNTDAGPDFLNAMVKIGTTTWAGHIEIHTKMSDWLAHKHNLDEKYKNVILHVVYTLDNSDATPHIPVVCIKDKFDDNLFSKYQEVFLRPCTLPCADHLHKIPSIIIEKYKETLLVSRWNDKHQHLLDDNKLPLNDWRQLSYFAFGKAFGFKINQEGMQRLLQYTPMNVLEKHKDQLFQLEAILMGQAQLIPTQFQDAYTQKLEKEYHFLRRKYNLSPINGSVWNFSRLRPANFPSIRIAQFAHFLYQTQMNFETLISNERNMLQVLEQLQIKTSTYFETHYRLSDQSTSKSAKHLGKMAMYHLIINAIAPLKYWYQLQYKPHSDNQLETAIQTLMQLPAEKNTLTKLWPLDMSTAFDSQSILQLINTKCISKECMQCSVGHYIMKKI